MQYCFISDVWLKHGEDQARMGTELKPPEVQPCVFGAQPSSILSFTMVRSPASLGVHEELSDKMLHKFS